MRCVALILGLLLTVPALADTQPAPTPQRIKGTIEAYDPVARTLSVTSGKKAWSVTLQANVRVITNQRRKLADIKPGDFVGAAALKGADGKLRAQRVDVFPEAFKGLGEGQYPMGEAANRIMTNATVAEVTSVAANSGTLKVSYRGSTAGADGTCSGHAAAEDNAGCNGSADIVVAPGIPVIALMLGDESLLVPGAAVSLVASTGSDGALVATRLTVEKDGVKPIL
ncbi:MAG TPA: DUF5666 domain-containing protein [Rhizomicrobium sp.]|nr:DUF5666 domain-containing protein [Rhizomicrobium sp.]